MPTPLKELYSADFYKSFTQVLTEVHPLADPKEFTKTIFCREWKSMELKERMKHTTKVLRTFFPNDFNKSAELICNIVDILQQRKMNHQALQYMFLPDYIETFGMEHFDKSVQTIEKVTQFTSCEFAVRPFIIKYVDRMMEQMVKWSLHKNYHVRRLASEGSRPRLPWAMALPELKKNPNPCLPILENLNNDPSEYVRRSVANHLNDVSKDHPSVVLRIAKKWKGKSEDTDAIIKHACRTLLKQGHPEIFAHYGLQDNLKVRLENFTLLNRKIKIGDYLVFSFKIKNEDKKNQELRLEYGIYYLKQNGTLSKKVFKISERNLKPGEVLNSERKQSFKIITTRVFYPGTHMVSLIINGVEKAVLEFELVK